MREFINTPCGRITDDLIDIHSPLRRTGLRSSRKPKAVTFEDRPTSPTRSSRKRSRSHSVSPRKVLALKDENARPATATGHTPAKQAKLATRERGTRTTRSKEVQDLEATIDELKLELSDKDQEIQRLKQLCQFLATEVRIYTTTFEEQARDLEGQLITQRLELGRLKGV